MNGYTGARVVSRRKLNADEVTLVAEHEVGGRFTVTVPWDKAMTIYREPTT